MGEGQLHLYEVVYEIQAQIKNRNPWFSHQHNPNYIDTNGMTVEVFDNGNVRCSGAAPGTCDSRWQVYQLNEQTMVATQTFNSDVGVFGIAQGTAQRLANGNFNFTTVCLCTRCRTAA